ncbi:cytochrome c and c1 heme-lyase [Tuber magnatum]|uniref:Holocytochrome c-type synthase n=1 Tax=Tuber magnatum TaxID=42249 RepID=A0A317SY90_9PEZI|nr:cytochrome c and c1 heme-lyase [Tuber magnatum]
MPSSGNPEPAAAATEADACPVPPSARSTWLSSVKASTSCDSSKMDQTPPAGHPKPSNLKLGVGREVSTIPRASMEGSNSEHDPRYQHPSSGNWIYPSEEMFFNAMKRKDWDPKAKDMRTIVPIHNAVNERAWKEIKEWEAGRGSEKCGGPKLVSFSGDSQKLTPKARFMVLLGYRAPFDRHDWVVDRCGRKIDYVIDFYSGKPDPKRPEALSFYLDVRPKLSPEGAWMRMQRWAGSFF